MLDCEFDQVCQREGVSKDLYFMSYMSCDVVYRMLGLAYIYPTPSNNGAVRSNDDHPVSEAKHD